jgi:hypothetical protein
VFSRLMAEDEVAEPKRRVRDMCAPEDEGTTTSREIRGMTETPWRSYFRAAPERDYVALLSCRSTALGPFHGLSCTPPVSSGNCAQALA